MGRVSYLLVTGNVEARGQRHGLGGMLGLPVLPELVLGEIRAALDVGDHLEEARVGGGTRGKRGRQ